MDTNSKNIAIIGAGVIGTTTAKLLQEQLPNANITIFAEKFHDDTTSYIAAGFFRPGTGFRGPTKDITKKWVNDSWHYWDNILKSPDASKIGVMSCPAYIFSKINPHVIWNPLIQDLCPIYRQCSDEEIRKQGPDWKYGSYFSTQVISCARYIPWVENNFIRNGGKIVNRKIDSISSLSAYDLVFNCSGLGAKFLCNDEFLIPIRGQVFKVRAPWLKAAYYGDLDTYVIPGLDGVATLGGTRQFDNYGIDVCKHDAAGIMERCLELVPGLKNAEVVAERVGLRPYRSVVRVEPEFMNNVKVVHCYGHGGYGVTCAPGTAIHAVNIGVDLLKSNIRTKL